jgi:glycosyltransferase involved in cell wall biosynthesis
MAEALHVVLPSDVFPPKCGGAGWSSHALAQALLTAGHTVTAVVPQANRRGEHRETVLGVPTLRVGYRVPSLPLIKNYLRHERFWPQLAKTLVRMASVASRSTLLFHAQHVQVAPAAILAGAQLGVPVIVTVRDHWPWDYFATGLHGDRLPLSRAGWVGLATDVLGRFGPFKGTLSLAALPYMLAHVWRRQAFLRRADCVVAVSHYIADRLVAIVPRSKIRVVPNMVDRESLATTIASPPQSIALDAPFVLYVGKLEQNKGAQFLPEIYRHASAARSLPLLIAGSGPLRPQIERELAALGVQVHFLDWIEHDEVLRLLTQCQVLLFPSAWGEPLSRVLLEACACGAPLLAMPTGGTPDVVVPGVNGFLEATPERFAARLDAMLADLPLLKRLRAGAHQIAAARFSSRQVLPQFETLYRQVLER